MATVTGGTVVWDLDVQAEKLASGLAQARDTVEKTTKDIGKSFMQVGKDMENMGRDLSLRVSAPIIAGFGFAAKAAIDFESSFAGVRKTVDASEAEFAQLEKNFRNISKVTPLAINDLNRIGEIAGSLGISGVANLTKFTETIAKIGITTNLTEEEAAMSFGRIINIMQESTDNVDRMGATVVDLGNKFASTEKDITEFSERIAGAGKIAGLSTANVFAIGTAMSSVGIEAEAGGTAVQKVLISMYQAASGSTEAFIDNSKAIGNNSDKLADLQKNLSLAIMKQKEFTSKTSATTKARNEAQIEKYNREIGQLQGTLGALNATQGQAAISAESFAKVLGVTNKEFTTMFKADPGLVFENFVLKLGEISKKGGDAAGVLEELELGDQRLIRAFLSLSNAGDLLSQTLTVGNVAWQKNSALNAEAEKRYATTSSQMQIMWNNINDLGIVIGSVLLPPINDLITALTPTIQAFAAWAQQHPELIKLAAGVLLVVAAVGPLILIIGSLITSIGAMMTVGGALIGAVGSIIGIFTAVIPVIAAVVAAIGWPVIAIGLLIAAVVGLGIVIYKNWDAITKFIKDNINTIVYWVGVVLLGPFIAIPMLIANALRSVPDAITAPFRSAFDWIMNQVNKVKEALNKINPLARFSPSLVDNVKKGVDIIQGEFGKLADISIPKVADSGIAGATDNPALAYAPSSPTVNIHIDRVNDRQDVDMLGRELGFKMALVK